MMYQHNQESLERITESARIDAAIDVMLKPRDRTVQQMIAERSRDADLALLGLRGINQGEELDYAQRLETLSGDLRNVMFVRSAGSFRGQLLGDTGDQRF